MTMTILEFSDINEATGGPIYPPHRRRDGQALSNTYIQIGETYPTRAVLVINDSGTTGIRVRVATASSGQNATQADQYIAADGERQFLIPRKRRTSNEATDQLWINAVADT